MFALVFATAYWFANSLLVQIYVGGLGPLGSLLLFSSSIHVNTINLTFTGFCVYHESSRLDLSFTGSMRSEIRTRELVRVHLPCEVKVGVVSYLHTGGLLAATNSETRHSAIDPCERVLHAALSSD